MPNSSLALPVEKLMVKLAAREVGQCFSVTQT
jgi:hypothetical protein